MRNMTEYTISDYTINKLREKRIFTIILTGIISIIIWSSLTLFVFIARNLSIKILIVVIILSIVIISLVMFFSLRVSLKLLIKKMKNVKYIILENESLFIKQDEMEQFNISKNDIKCINRYKNKDVIIILNSNKNILINKYLDNYNQFIENLNLLSQINEVNKNPNVNNAWLMEKLVSFIILFPTLILGIIIIKKFNISLPNKNDPIYFILTVPVLIFGWFTTSVSNKITERIKDIKHISIIVHTLSLVSIIVFFIVFFRSFS